MRAALSSVADAAPVVDVVVSICVDALDEAFDDDEVALTAALAILLLLLLLKFVAEVGSAFGAEARGDINRFEPLPPTHSDHQQSKRRRADRMSTH